MENFLKQCKQELTCIEKHKSICIVLGNQSCDLDSAVSALVYARSLSCSQKFGEVVIPLLNVSRDDFPLKTEVKYYLSKFGITSDLLMFREDIDMDTLRARNKLKLVLVDHNVLMPPFTQLDDAVVQIVDHHILEHSPSGTIDMTVEVVGSCATLVATIVLLETPTILDVQSTMLLIGPILVDTANFSASVKWATGKDRETYNALVKTAPAGFSSDALYRELLAAKEDISGLTLKQLLNKDAKNVDMEGGIQLFVCAFPCLTAVLVEKFADIVEVLQDHCSAGQYHGGVLMGIEISKETNSFRRDIIVFSPHPELKNQLCEGLELGEPCLELEKMGTLFSADHRCTFYRQGNVAATRKKVIPMLKSLKLSIPTSLPN